VRIIEDHQWVATQPILEVRLWWAIQLLGLANTLTHGLNTAQGYRPPPVDTNIPVAVSVNGKSQLCIIDTANPPIHSLKEKCPTSFMIIIIAGMASGSNLGMGSGDMDTPHAKLLEVVSRNIPLPKDYKTPKPARKPPTASIKWTPDEDQRLREVS